MDAVHLMRRSLVGLDNQGRGLLPRPPRLGAGVGHTRGDVIGLPTDRRAPASTGIPEAFLALTKIASFNSLESVRRLLEEYPVRLPDDH